MKKFVIDYESIINSKEKIYASRTDKLSCQATQNISSSQLNGISTSTTGLGGEPDILILSEQEKDYVAEYLAGSFIDELKFL